jgi:hypothetical protein
VEVVMPMEIVVDGKTWTVRCRHFTEAGLSRAWARSLKRKNAGKITPEQFDEEAKRYANDSADRLRFMKQAGGTESFIDGVTRVEVDVPEYGQFEGIALCSKKDRFNPNKGFNIAMRRALNFMSRERRAAFWIAFNAKYRIGAAVAQAAKAVVAATKPEPAA